MRTGDEDLGETEPRECVEAISGQSLEERGQRVCVVDHIFFRQGAQYSDSGYGMD